MKNLKTNLTALALTGTLLLTMTGLTGKVEAAEIKEEVLTVSKGTNVYVNDTYFVPVDANGNEVRPFIYNGSTYLPVRAVGEAYGVKIGWDGRVLISGEANKDVVIPSTNKTSIPITETKINAVTGVEILVDGKEFIPKDANGNVVPVILSNGTTYLPVRAISNLYGIDINWDSKTGNVYIGKHEVKPNPYDIELKRGSDGKYVLPETQTERIEFAGKVLKMNEYYTNLLKPYSEEAGQKCIMVSNLTNYLILQLSKECNGYLNDDLERIAPSEMSVYYNLRAELTEKDNDFYKILTVEESYMILNEKYNRINQYDGNLVYYEFCASTEEKKLLYENIENIMNGMNEKIYQDYVNRIDNLVKNISQKVNGRSLTLN